MKTSKLKSKLIVLHSLWTTLYRSLNVLFRACFSKLSDRDAMDMQVHLWASKLLDIVKLRYTVENPHNVQFDNNHQIILMSNHISHYDIPLICEAIPGSVRMIAKKQLFDVPLWGSAMKKCEFISIDRENARQAVRDLAVARQKMKSGILVWIAPEGTRSRDGSLQPFKKGGFKLAQQTKATIIPIAIKGTYEVLPPKTTQFEIGRRATVHICQPIETTSYDKNDTNQLVTDVHQAIQQALDNMASAPNH